MQAQKIVTYTDETGRVIDMPTFQPRQRIELILLYTEDSYPAAHKKRSPPPKIKGAITEKGDIFSSAPESDWGIS